MLSGQCYFYCRFTADKYITRYHDLSDFFPVVTSVTNPPAWSIPAKLYAAINGNKAAAEASLKKVREKVESTESLDGADRQYIAWFLEILAEKGSDLFPDKMTDPVEDNSNLSKVERDMALLDLVDVKMKEAEEKGEKSNITKALQHATEDIVKLGFSTGDYLPKKLRKVSREWQLAMAVADCIMEDDDFLQREQRAYDSAAEKLSKGKNPPSADDCRNAYTHLKQFILNHYSSLTSELPDEV